MTPRHLRLSIVAAALVVGACSSGGGTATPPPVAKSSLAATIVPAPTASLATTPAPSSSGLGTGPQATPTFVDPCTLLRTEEATTLMGRKMSAGVASLAGPDRVCTWKDGLTEVKLFLTPRAPDPATAQAYWDQLRGEIPADVHVDDLSLFDRAAFGTGASAGVSVSALVVLDGVQAFDLYCGFPACGEVASVAAAELIAGRLP